MKIPEGIKRFSIICVFVLAVGGVRTPSFAQPRFDLEVSHPNPVMGETTEVEIWVKDMSGTDLFTFDFCLRYDSTKLDVTSMQINDTEVGGCVASAFSITNDNGSDCVRLGGGKFPGTTCSFPHDYLLATVGFKVLQVTGTTLCASCSCQAQDGCGHGFNGYVEDETGWQYPAEKCSPINGGGPVTSSTTTSVPQPPQTTTSITASSTTTSAQVVTTTTTTTSSPTSSSSTTTSVGPCAFKKLYGDTSPKVHLLYSIRDEVLDKNPEGREIIDLYYKWSPAIVSVMEKDEGFRKELKDMVDGFLW